MPRFVLVSDTHNMLDQIILPEGDILLHAGDATMTGDIPEIKMFNHHLGNIKHKFKHIVYVPGNHDFCMQDFPDIRHLMIDQAIVLIDEYIDLLGYRIYGSPWQPWYYDWAFNFPENDKNLRVARETWAKIPDNTDILITHGPPYMMLDKVAHSRSNQDPHVGCKALSERIDQLPNLLVHMFGHIHERYGQIQTSKVHFVNASLCTLQYRPTNAPIVIDLPERVQQVKDYESGS